MFHLDPVLLLEETDDLRWMVRVAAYNVVMKDRSEAKAHANEHRGVRGSRR